MAASMAMRQVVNVVHYSSHVQFSQSGTAKPKSPTFINTNNTDHFLTLARVSSKCNRIAVPKASSSAGRISPVGDDEEGVSLGTMKLPANIDVARFETLLFQVHFYQL